MTFRTGQTSMMVIVLAIIIFMMLGIFLLISSLKPVNNEYNNIYSHNLLLTVLRSNTGYGGSCDTISAAISCAYMTPHRNCGDEECRSLSTQLVPGRVASIIKPSFDYCLIVEPEDSSGGEQLLYGPNCGAVASKNQKWTANEKILQYGANLNIKMILVEK